MAVMAWIVAGGLAMQELALGQRAAAGGTATDEGCL